VKSSLLLFFLVVFACVLSCGSKTGAGDIGSACATDPDCATGLGCGNDPFPGGYCTQDCSAAACPGDHQICSAVAGQNLCLKSCADRSECRSDYQCFGGVCTLACATDDECGKGFHCDAGQCTPFDGSPVGAACTVDNDCSSRLCLLGTCALSCARDLTCAEGQTCGLNAVGDGNRATPATHIAPACVPRRGGAANGARCDQDAVCDRGTCQLGVCVELCTTTQDCHGSGLTCAKMVAPLDNDALPGFSACLPQKGILDVPSTSLYLPLPSNAQSFAIYSRLDVFDFNDNVGVISLKDPTGAVVYAPPTTLAEYFQLQVRYQPTESTSTMLVPNQPRLKLVPGAYTYGVGSDGLVDTTTRIFIKLGDGPIASGTATLNFYLTDLTGSCHPMTVATAPTELASVVARLKQIYAQANVTITAVNYRSALGAHNVVREGAMTMLPDLDETLQAATTNQPGPPGLDIVIVRAITDENMKPSGVLGIAGGIPASPVLGTPHSGAIISISTLCQNLFGEVAGHELGHTLGLFHSVEQSGDKDPLTDTSVDGQQNLMYWLENSGTHLSVQQSQVVRNDPKVQP
jgi:hypothetical protein